MLCVVAGPMMLAAQQPGGTPRTKEGSAAPASVASPVLPRFEPMAAFRSAPARPLLLASEGSNHTFVFSTLALVLMGVIAVLLVVN